MSQTSGSPLKSASAEGRETMLRQSSPLVQLPRRGNHLRLLLGWFSLLTVLGVGTQVLAQEPPKTPAGKQKTVRFEMRDNPWEKVLEWLSDNTGLPVSANIKPQGTFTHFSPKDKEYTIPEVIDFLNDTLLTQKLPGPSIIIRRPEKLLLIPADDPQSLDVNLLPRIMPEDLQADEPSAKQRYGRTELAQIIIQLQSLTPEEAQRDLTPMKGPFGKITPIAKGNRLLVTDSVGNLRRMKRYLDENDSPADEKLEFLPLGALDGMVVLATLQKQWGIVTGGARPAGAPSQLDLDTTFNRIIIRGTEAQRKLAKETIAAFRGGSGGAGGAAANATETMRIVRLDGTTSSGAVMANLAHLWSSLRANPVRIMTQSQLQQQMEQFGKKPAAPPAVPSRPIHTQEAATRGQEEVVLAQFPGTPQQPQQKPGQLTDPRQAPGGIQLPGDPNKPVYIAPLSQGNGLMIASEDPEAVVLVEEMIRYLTQAGEGDYEVIGVRHTSAVELAKVLDEYFNGKQQRGGGGNPMMMMMGMGGGRQEQRGPQGPTVRIVADPRTNSLLVKAPKMTIAEIKRILETYLDVPDPSSETAARQYIIGPLKHHTAAAVAEVLRTIFADFIRRETRQPQMPQIPFPFNQQREEPAPRGGPQIAIAVDEVSNRILVNCPEAYFKPIKDMVEELDKGAVANKQEIEVIRPGGVDPALLQQALNVISGKSNTTQNPNQQQPQMDPFMRNQFGNMGGMNRGMGGMGGGNRGGGGGNRGMGGGRGGGGQRPEDSSGASLTPGGPHFFVGRVMDDPRTAGLKTVLYDPQQDPVPATFPAFVEVPLSSPQQPPAGGAQPPAAGQQPPGAQPGADATGQAGDAQAPRRPLQIDVLPDGTVILIGDPADVAAVKKIIAQLTELAKVSETDIRIVRLVSGDANSITNTLTQLYQRVNIGASSNSLTRQGQAPAFVPQGATQTQGPASIVLIAVPRFNAILVAAPRGRMTDIEKHIRELDLPINTATLKTFPLRKQNAATVAGLIQQIFGSRYNEQSPTTTIFQVQSDASTNSVIVQASPADMTEIEHFITFLETTTSKVETEVRIVALKNATATDIVSILQSAISQSLGVGALLPGAGQQQRPGAGGQQQIPGGGPQQFPGGQQQFGGQQPGGQQRGGAGNLMQQMQQLGGQTSSRGSILGMPGMSGTIESTVLSEVRAFADPRTNSIIVSAPKDSIELIVALIKQLDVQPSATAEIKVFQLKKADATLIQNVLLQIFMGQNSGTRPGQGAQGIGGLFGGGQLGQFQPLSFAPVAGEPPGLADVRISVDTRTNSLIVAASRGNMILAEAIVNNLDNAQIRERRIEVYRLKNTVAQDIANTLSTLLQQDVQILTTTGEATAFTQGERQVIVVPENVSNSLVISASPQYYDRVIKLVQQLDAEPPQVAIAVLIAEVTLDNTDEFGVEWGVQSPIWFRRGLITGTGSFATPAVPSGVTVSNVATSIANPGYNFNSINPLPTLAVSPGVVAPQGFSNLGVGRNSTNAGVGGFVFSAGSDAVNVLIRALKVQGKIEVLSRPQITTLDNQVAFIQVGQTVPYITNSTIGVNGQITNTVLQQPVGIILQVTPKINEDGNVVMRVEPQVSSLSTSTVNLGNNVFAPIFNITQAATTVAAQHGQTIVIGGLITRRDDKLERKIPFLGELEYIGAAFRFRTYVKRKSELLIIMTPFVVRNKSDAYRVLATEARKMDWALNRVHAIHGPLGVEPELAGGYGMGDCGCNGQVPPTGTLLPPDLNQFGPPVLPPPTLVQPQQEVAPQLTPMPQQRPVPPIPQPQRPQPFPPGDRVPGAPLPGQTFQQSQPGGGMQHVNQPVGAESPPAVGPSVPGRAQPTYPTDLPSPYPMKPAGGIPGTSAPRGMPQGFVPPQAQGQVAYPYSSGRVQ